MFACIYGRGVSQSTASSPEVDGRLLLDLAFTFSPLVEQAALNTVALDISGQDLLFASPVVSPQAITSEAEIDSARNLANEIVRRAAALKFRVNVAVATTPDVAIHAARLFKGMTIIRAGEELSKLGSFTIDKLDPSLVGIAADRVAEIQETFALWGIRTFADLAALPLTGVAERLGQEGVRLQRLAQGRTDRRLNLVRPPVGFEQLLALEHPVAELEPFSFILSRLLNQLCANLYESALATNELRLNLRLEDKTEHDRVITLPVPMRNAKTLLRLLLFDIEAQPPTSPITEVRIRAEPVKPRASQAGLFVPLAPEPERLEITLARLAKLVGRDNVGSPQLLDTHRPDAFRMTRFTLVSGKRKKDSNRKSEIANRQCVMGFRLFRPAWRADVQMNRGRPARINTWSGKSSNVLRGKVVCAAGPWRRSGDWWRSDMWARDEWDVAVIDSAFPQNEVLCRIYRELSSEKWFVEGIYD